MTHESLTDSEETLHAFCKDWLHWAKYGCPKADWRENYADTGLCTALRQFCCHTGRNLPYNTGLTDYIFSGDYAAYQREMAARKSADNPKRVAWVKDTIARLSEETPQ